MSGHSHFKTVKATKDANDAKRGKIFSKFGRLIAIAAKEGGKDPASNIKLKAAIERARNFNMPKENIERAVKKGSGETDGEILEEVSFEGFGPGGIALIIEGITDNKNRTLGEIKSILGQYGGKMAGEGAIKWMFVKKGSVSATCEGKQKEEAEMAAIDAGAEDFKWSDNVLIAYSAPENLDSLKKSLEEKGFHICSASLEWIPKEDILLNEKDREAAEKLFEALDENDAIQDIYSNLKE